MRELVRGYATAAFESAQEAGNFAVVASDLGAFCSTVWASDSLRRALSDGMVPVGSRRDVVVELLEGKAAAVSTAIVSFVLRVERAAEVPAALDGVVLLGEHFEQSGIEGTMDAHGERAAVRDRIRGYAERVLQKLEALGEVDEVEDELFRFARLLDDNVNLRRVLQDTGAPIDGRLAIVNDLLAQKARPATVRLVSYVLRAGRSRDLVGIFEWLVDLAAQERGRRLAEVRSAVDLDQAERDRLSDALGRLVERTVEVRVIKDPKVIGGMHITVGDLVIDGSVRVRFERLRDLLAQAS